MGKIAVVAVAVMYGTERDPIWDKTQNVDSSLRT